MPLDNDEDPIDESEGGRRMSQEEAELLCSAISMIRWGMGTTRAVILRPYVSKLHVLIPVGILAAFIRG